MKSTKMLLITGFVLVILSNPICKAQTDSLSTADYPNDPVWYFSFGVSPFSHYISAPPVTIPNVEPGLPSNLNVFRSYQYASLNLISFTYSVRYNIARIDDDRSLSLAVPPTLGLTSIRCKDGSTGFLSLSIPLMVEYNSGVASNFSTLKWKGWMVGAGADLNIFPLISNEKYAYSDAVNVPKTIQPSHSWVQPSVEFAYRWINTDQNTREVNFKVGYGFARKIQGVEKVEVFHPVSAKLSYLFFINY